MKNIDTYEVSESIKRNIKEVFASHLYCIFRYYPNCTKSEKKHIKSLIKQNKQIFSLTQERGKKIVYYTLKLFGVGFAIATLRLLRKFKIVK